VQDLEKSTARLGDLLRDFQKTVCPEYNTYGLPAEETARTRRRVRKATAPPSTHVYADSGCEEDEQVQRKGKKKKKTRKTRQFNLDSYKMHSLGDYAKAIRLYGTTDNYNSQTVCVFFYVNYLLLTFCISTRVSSSIDEQNGATSVLTRENILLALESKCAVSVTSIEHKLYVERNLFVKQSPRVRMHFLLYRLQTNIITSRWIHAQSSFFLSG